LLLGIVGLIAVPILMKWHHPLLIISWNAFITPSFLRGQLQLWILMALASTLIWVLNRSVDPDKRLISVPSLSRPLAFFTGVVVLTAFLTGGLGFRALGSAHYGGKGYIQLVGAILGYFAITSKRIPPERAWLYVGLFFLPMLTSLMGGLIFYMGHQFYFLYSIFPATTAANQLAAESGPIDFSRYGALSSAGWGIYCFLLARFGMRGVFDLSKPWRLFFFVLAMLGCLFCGYRGALVMFALTCLAMFWLEGLWRTRTLPILISAMICGMALVIAFANKLPGGAQRSLAILPIKLDPMVRASAQASSDWRIQMWKDELEELPKYLLLGKGYSLDPQAMYMADESAMRGVASSYEGAKEAGDFHSGPLTVIVPFGSLGVIAFVWFMAAALRLLYNNYRYGDPALLSVNTLLLSAFSAELFFFIFLFGGLKDGFCLFSGIAGLSVSLNGGMCQRPAEQTVSALEELQLSEPI